MFTSKLPTQAFGIPKADNFLEAPTKFWLHSLVGFMCPPETLQARGSARVWIAIGVLCTSMGSCQRPESPPAPVEGSAIPSQISTLATLTRPTAAALSADGKTVYVLAQDQTHAFQIYSGGVGAPLSVLRTSQPLSYPVAIAVNRTGSQLFILDLGATDLANPTGAVYRVSQDGTISVLSDSAPTHPTAIALSRDDQQLFVGGIDGEAPAAQAGVWKLPTSGGSSVPVFVGSPLSQPIGVAIASDGGLYVADAQGSLMGTGGIFHIAGERAFPVGTAPLRLTYPAGLCPAGRVSAGLLFASPRMGDADPWLTQLTPDGQQEVVDLPAVTEATALSRAADTDLWVAIDALIPSETTATDPDALDQAQGRVLLLSP